MQQIKKWFAPHDMTQGVPWKRIGAFAVPMLVGNFVQQLYNTVDSAVVGHYIGDGALAAVNGAMPAISMLIVLFTGISTGAGIRVSQYFGARDRENLSLVIGNCITLTALISIVTMVLGTALAYPLLHLLKSPLEIIGWTADYLQIYFLGISGFMYYNIFAGILRGMGDSLSALLFLLLSASLNVVLDLLLVGPMGVAGVALATILAQGISAVLCYMKLSRMKDTFDINRSTLKLKKDVVTDIVRLGLPSGITQMTFSLAMLMVMRLENSFGVAFVASTSIVKRVDGYAMMPNFTFGMAMTTYIGQNVGARRYDRLHTGARQGMLLAVGTATVLTGLILIFGRDIMHIFTETKSVIDMSMRLMYILALGYIAMAVLQTMSGVMRGAGDTVTPMLISIGTSVFIRVTLAYLLVHLSKSPEYPDGRPEMIHVSLLLTWLIGACINYLAYKYGRWRKKLPVDDGLSPDIPATYRKEKLS